MATQYATIKGSLKWARVYEPDEAFGTKNWKLCLYPSDEKEWDKFKKTGLQLVVKEDVDGKYITLRRPVQKLIRDDLVVFSPPEITGEVNVKYVNADGEKVRQFNKGDGTKVSREGDPVLIGNGSVGLVNFSYYSTAKGFGHRLESVRILELVGYEPNKQPEEPKEEPKSVTKEAPKKVVKQKTEVEEDLNDEIPW